MKILTDNEIYRTAFKYFKPTMISPYGYLTKRDKNEMCPYCYNEDTDIIIDKSYLTNFVDFYNKRNITKFTVIHCFACNAIFSFYKINGV